MATESAQYDQLASGYDTWGDLPGEKLSHRSMKRTIGPVPDLNVLDLACGTGVATRLALSLGAKFVVGVDISSGMVDIATATPPPPNTDGIIKYHVHDLTKPLELPASHLPDNDAKQFDMVTAMWLLSYSSTPDELTQMFKNITTHLKPGGRLVGINPNFTRTGKGLQLKYGITQGELVEVPYGFSVRATVHINPEVHLDAFLLKEEYYYKAAQEAGLEDFKFVAPSWDLLEEGEDRAFWEDWMEEPVYLIMTATKKQE